MLTGQGIVNTGTHTPMLTDQGGCHPRGERKGINVDNGTLIIELLISCADAAWACGGTKHNNGAGVAGALRVWVL